MEKRKLKKRNKEKIKNGNVRTTKWKCQIDEVDKELQKRKLQNDDLKRRKCQSMEGQNGSDRKNKCPVKAARAKP